MTAAVKVKSVLDQSRRALAEVADAVETTRVRIGKLREQRAKVAEQYASKEDAIRALDEWLEALPVNGPDVSYIVSADRREARLGLNVKPDSPFDAFGWLIFGLLREQVRAAAVTKLDAIYAQHEGINEADRKVGLAALDRELLDLNLTEEALIRSAEAAGLLINRRADASPAAVLAHDSELPK